MKVSVVIPTCNRAAMVCDCVASVLASDYPDFEVIVVDDCSPDDTGARLAVRFGGDRRVRCIRSETNLRTAGARNLGEGCPLFAVYHCGVALRNRRFDIAWAFLKGSIRGWGNCAAASHASGRAHQDEGAAQEQEKIREFRWYRGYDYSRGAALFLTVVTEPRRRWFGRVVDGRVELNQLGQIVEQSLCEIPLRNKGLVLHSHVVMPDHLHLRLYLESGHADGPRRVGEAMRRFKQFTVRQSRAFGGDGRLWQQGAHNRICMNRAFIEAVDRYIKYNPLKDELRRNHPEYLAIHEPLENARLKPEDFWRGIGNAVLLDAEKLMAVRISRQVPETEFPQMIARFQKGAAEGWVFVGGWISPGEKAVRDALLADGGRLVQVLPSMMPHDYLPSNIYFNAIHQNRALILAKGNDEIAFSRAACLDLNAEAAALADRAVYWRGEERIARPQAAHQDGERGRNEE